MCNEAWQSGCPVSRHITDGVPNYTSSTGKDPVFRSYSITELLRREVV